MGNVTVANPGYIEADPQMKADPAQRKSAILAGHCGHREVGICLP